MRLLALETSCDETSAAVVCDGRLLSNVVASQVRLHAEYGGVVPELATREHLRNTMPVVRQALGEADLGAVDLDAVAATRGPGLPPALVIGWRVAQALAYSLDRPLYGINHLEAHLLSPWVSGDPPAADYDNFRSNVSLIVSGGHTLLVEMSGIMQHRVLGGTLDDAAGECFDKVAKLMGLPYPGGPEVDRLAEEGSAAAFFFPRPMLARPGDDFSFSGLKTSVRYFLDQNPELKTDDARLPDLCASVRAAIVEVLVGKTMAAARRLGMTCVTASGGVMCNRALRRELEAACVEQGMVLRLAPPSLCTDNAGMVGLLAELFTKRKATRTSGIGADIQLSRNSGALAG
ncbi:MAG: tRNA (adenosine(37)-N6)-threonylcarbamoyltransferase complex transferase subunit TsaD [Verrucomicrobiota bacterium]|nr:tRNA (adenosine(37)-N6)-threonylcarbamoyltransferase complex transferase subunit TsaD [Verrucomicrobiota bacterium]